MARGRSRRPRDTVPTMEANSAGGVVFRPTGKVLLLKRADEGRWCLPKGGIEEGEGPEDAAVREIREETGLYCQLVERIADVHYKYYWASDQVNYDKTVIYYLAEVVGGTVKRERIFEAHRWCGEKEALSLLHYENDRRVVREAFARMRGMGGRDT